MKRCIQCKQLIPDDCDVCTYCCQWQENIEKEDNIETTKQCIKCKNYIPIDCGECTFCGQPQPISENEKDKGNTLNAENTEKKNLKEQWKTVVGVIAGIAISFLGIISMITTPSTKTESYSTDYQTDTTRTEFIDNSVNGNGYYYFDNELNESTVEKFNNAFYGDTNLLDISVNNFSYIEDVMLLDEKVSEYNYIDFNGKTGVHIYVNEDNQVPAFTFAYDVNMVNNATTTDTYKIKQLVDRPASWIYALSDTLTYEEAYDIYETLFFEHVDAVAEAKEGKEKVVAHYYNGYTIVISTSGAFVYISVLKTDSNFIDKHNIKVGGKLIFQPIDAGTDENPTVLTTNEETIEETTISESTTVSNEEIADAEDLLREESFGSDYLGSQFSDALNVLDAIYYYLDDVTLEATKDYDGNIVLKYTGIFYNETNYVTYEVNTKNGYVNFIESSFSWESFKEFYPADLYNDYMQGQ